MHGCALITRVLILSKVIGRLNITGDELDDDRYTMFEAEAWAAAGDAVR
jgi:hypothetical protein